MKYFISDLHISLILNQNNLVGKRYRDSIKIPQTPSPPPSQAINSDPLQSSLMQLNRIDLKKLK